MIFKTQREKKPHLLSIWGNLLIYWSLSLGACLDPLISPLKDCLTPFWSRSQSLQLATHKRLPLLVDDRSLTAIPDSKLAVVPKWGRKVAICDLQDDILTWSFLTHRVTNGIFTQQHTDHAYHSTHMTITWHNYLHLQQSCEHHVHNVMGSHVSQIQSPIL